MTFGTPIGRPSIALAPSTAPSAPPRRDHAVELAVAIELEREPLQAGEHAVHGLAAAAGVAQRIDRRPAEPRDFRARHVGYDVERPAEDARVGDDGAEAERLQAIANVCDLGALGIECADEQDRLHATCASGAS